MQYLSAEPFTVPVNDGKITQKSWDRAFLSPDEFRRKYGVEPEPQEPGDHDGR